MICIKCKAEVPGSPYCPKCGKKQVPEPRKSRTRGNGQGSAYKLANGKWRAEVTLRYDENGKRIYKTKSGFNTKKEALAYLAVLVKPQYVDMTIKFAALYDEWSKQHYKSISKASEYGYKAAYNYCKDLYPRRFIDLKARDLQAVVDACEHQRRSKADIKSLLNNMYKYAQQNDYCDKNYAQFIKLPPKPKTKNDSFTAAEIKKLWDDYAAGNDFTGYILVMIYTGMRYGELATVLKKNINLTERCMIGGIKTNAGIDREIPIADKILPIVTRLYLAGNKKLLEIPEKVFYTNFHATLSRLGIRPLPPHCCRHTFSTMMARAGIQPAIITETAGHEDYSTTLLYTHIQLAEKLNAVNQL